MLTALNPFYRKNPIKDEIEKADKVALHTPDLWFLLSHTHWLVFLYSHDQRHQHQHKRLNKEAEYKCDAYSCDKYAVWKKNLGSESFCVALDKAYAGYQDTGINKKDGTLQSVKGELHLVRPRHIVSLDQLHENTVEFKRRRVTVDVPWRFTYQDRYLNNKVSGLQHTKVVAWMYVGIQDFWDTQINDFSFAPVKVYENLRDVPPYYSFSRIDWQR
jgi:hypothetical protein